MTRPVASPRVAGMQPPDAPAQRFLGWRMVFAGFVAQLVYSALMWRESTANQGSIYQLP